MPAEKTRLDLPVKGMHCAACVGKVERALQGVPGVEKAVANLATERATVWLGGKGPDLPALREAVAAAGYRVPDEIAAGPDTADRERGYVEAALMITQGNLTQAAKLLGIHRTTLYSRMQNYADAGGEAGKAQARPNGK